MADVTVKRIEEFERTFGGMLKARARLVLRAKTFGSSSHVTGPEPALVLATGGSPGAAYVPPEFTDRALPPSS